MAAGHNSECPAFYDNSTLKNKVIDPQNPKFSQLLLSDNDMIWEGDLESLKRFVKTELQINGRWSTPRGENIKFSNPEFSLKWDYTTGKKITVTKDNDENQLYKILRSYATISKEDNNENQKNTDEHVVKANTKHEDKHVNATESNTDQKCEQCDLYKRDMNDPLAMINGIKKKQNEECQITSQTNAKMSALLNENEKMAAEISSLKTTMEGIAIENNVIKRILDIKQLEWSNAATTNKKNKETETTNSIPTNLNRFQVLPIEEQDENVNDEDMRENLHSPSNSTDHGHENEGKAEKYIDQQMTDYFNKQRAKFHTMKKANSHDNKRARKLKTSDSSLQPQEKAVLVIGDSMVKNMDEKKLKRAAKKATVCHSYSGARIGQIKEKIEDYWNEDNQFQEIILHVGTNDLVHEQPENVAKEMEALINVVKGKTEKIAVSSVIKRYDNKVRASNIHKYNHLIHELCVKHKITFINNDCIDQQLLNRSNLHLNKNGDRALGSAFCTYLKQNTTNIRSSRNIDNWDFYKTRSTN